MARCKLYISIAIWSINWRLLYCIDVNLQRCNYPIDMGLNNDILDPKYWILWLNDNNSFTILDAYKTIFYYLLIQHWYLPFFEQYFYKNGFWKKFQIYNEVFFKLTLGSNTRFSSSYPIFSLIWVHLGVFTYDSNL